MNKIEWEGSDTQKWKHARASLSMLGNLAFFILASAVFFQNHLFQKKNLPGIQSVCHTVWIQIRPDPLSGLI